MSASFLAISVTYAVAGCVLMAGYDDDGELDVVTATAELDGVPAMTVEFSLRLVNDEVGLAGFRAFPSKDGETVALHSEWATRLRLTEFAKQIERDVKRPSVQMTMPEEWNTAPIKVVKRPGRAGYGPAFYAKWAQRYLEALYDEDRRLPVYKHLAAMYPGNRAETIAQWITKARNEARVLSETGKGKRGGELTERGKRLLAGHDDEEV